MLSLTRRAMLVGLVSVMYAFLADAPAAFADAHVPALDGPSVRLDFGQPFIERWLTAPPADFVKVEIPRMEGIGWREAKNPALWEGAAVLGPLVREEPRTEFRAFYTDEALFLRARNWFDPDTPPQARMRERNRYASGEDLIEIRLRVPTDRAGQSRYRPRDEKENPVFHFIVNQAGAIYDAKAGDTGHDPHWESAVETGEEVWTLWAMIPFAALELPHAVPELEMNIGRDGANVATLSWGPEWAGTAQRRILLEGVPASMALRARAHDDAKEAEAEDIAGASIRSGRGVSLDWVSGFARPQDRWIEGTVRVDGEFVEAGAEVEVSVFAPGEATPLDTVRAKAERSSGRVFVDLRRWGLEAAKVSARLLGDGDPVGLAESFVEARPLPPAPSDGYRIPLKVDVPEGPGADGAHPVNVGVPMPAGLLWQAEGWRVEDAAGQAYPTQLEATGLWAFEGSVQWLRVDTVADPRAELSLVYRADAPPPAPEGAVWALAREDGSVLLSNGAAEYELSAERSPILSVRGEGRTLASAAQTRGLYVVDQQGRTAVASATDADVQVEAAGPVAASVRIEGDYRTEDGEALARHITRVELAAGQPFARVTHTLVLTRDTNEVWLREVGWEMDLAEGTDAEALFGTSRMDAAAHRRASPDEEVYALQESYYRFGGGEKRFRLMRGDEELLSGEEMGDWFMAQNRSAGLLLSCRDSARQHPKEFHVQGRRMNLKLFSPRAGEELDFRSETLAEKWNLRNWYSNDGRGRISKEDLDQRIENVKRIPSNALGWAKTHHILFSPAPGPRSPEQAAGASNWHSRPVFALADPDWTYRSKAMGALHPRDPERFPEAERLVDGALGFFASRVPTFGEWGFVDYYAGPHLNQRGKYPQARRWALTYTLRPDSWRVFARSGLREAYDFATKTNRSWGDNYLASWGDAARTKGLYASASGPDRPDGAPSLPFYWGHRTVTNRSSSTNLNQFLWDYHITGYRRAGDQVRDFAEGIKQFLTPQTMERDWRILMTFRTLIQCYNFTWDNDLRELAYAAADSFEDPEGAIGLTKERPYRSSTYKTRVDVRAIVEAWQLFGDPRFHRLSRTLGDYIWNALVGRAPISYTNPQGFLGQFLYDETRNPMIAQALLLQMRWASSQYDPEAEGHGITLGAHAVTPIFEGIPAMQDAIVRADADRRPAGSWAAARDFENPVEFAFFKADQETVRLSLKTPSGPGAAVGGPKMEAIEPSSTFGVEALRGFQQRSKQGDDMYTRWTAFRDVPEGAVKVSPSDFGTHCAVAWGDPPLILHAPSYWVPWPPQSPAVRWFFKVPEAASHPAVFFEGKANLYDPDGQLFKESGPVAEWIDLPADRPGMWSFEPLEERLVRVRNLPPFFAAESAERWFDPGIAWRPEPDEDPEPVETPDETGFVQGVSGRPGDKALYVSQRGNFAFDGGEPLPEEGQGTEFLPFHQGTIEFWLRPAWGTFDFPRGRRNWQRIFRMATERESWDLSYVMDYSDTTDLWSHNLYAIAWAQGEDRRRTFRNWRRYTVFEPNEWVHIAVVWGPRVQATHRGPTELLSLITYVNGRAGSRHHMERNLFGHVPADMPKRLTFLRLNGAIDHLRVSDVMRYQRDFEPPSRMAPPEVDERTHAYFPFDGTLEGVSGDGRTIVGEIAP